MRRFFYAVDDSRNALSYLPIGSSLELGDSITHHWCRVLRASVGDQGVLFDGFGGEYQVQLETISKKNATAILLSHNDIDRTAPIYSQIGLVMSRGERMDYAIQKATELGVTAIQLLTSQHGEVNLKAAQIDKKLLHWQQVAIAACEQCGLNRPPLILSPLSIEHWLQHLQASSLPIPKAVSPIVASLSLDSYYQILSTQAHLQLQLSVPALDEPALPDKLSVLMQQHNPYVQLLIGPEGGLSIDEGVLAAQHGFGAWQIGARVLRTETAPVVALATLHALCAHS